MIVALRNPALRFHIFLGKKKRDTGYGYHYNRPRPWYQRYLPKHWFERRDGYGEPEECGTIEDCFDQPCPRYGYVARYEFDRDGETSRHGISERQTGEGFRSASPPDCRTIAG